MKIFKRLPLEWALSEELLHGRMAFIAGPRQIGKTTAIQQFLDGRQGGHLYYNWDSPLVKKRFAQNPAFFMEDLPADKPVTWVGLDEIHKYPKWKNVLKGYYDEWHKTVRFVVTGSARLDLFRKSGDSLVGRYFLFRMLPLGVREVVPGGAFKNPPWEPGQDWGVIPEENKEIQEAFDTLISLTGYPEPFTVGERTFYTKWREDHVSLITHEDLRDLTKITHIRKLETLLYLLPERVGAPLSVNNLGGPLEATYGSLKTWLDALQLVYLVFSIPPWTRKLARAILKEEKYYFWDWGMVENPGTRFENFIAVQLMRAVSYWNEKGLGPFSLSYVKTKDGDEVDFAVGDKKKIHFLVEAKAQDTNLSPSLARFKEKLGVDLAFQVVQGAGVAVQKHKGVYVLGADRFLSLMP